MRLLARLLIVCAAAHGLDNDDISTGPGVSTEHVATNTVRVPWDAPLGPECKPWCKGPCSDLNGNIEQECGNCPTDGSYGCHARADNFDDWFDRSVTFAKSVVESGATVQNGADISEKAAKVESLLRGGGWRVGIGGENSLPLSSLSAGPALGSIFDEQHGCHEAELQPCNTLPAPVEAGEDVVVATGRSYCTHARCHAASAVHGGGIDIRTLVATPELFMSHPNFPVRLAATELMCASQTSEPAA